MNEWVVVVSENDLAQRRRLRIFYLRRAVVDVSIAVNALGDGRRGSS